MVVSFSPRNDIVASYLSNILNKDALGRYIISDDNLVGYKVSYHINKKHLIPLEVPHDNEILLLSYDADVLSSERLCFSPNATADINSAIYYLLDLDFKEFWLHGVAIGLERKEISLQFAVSRGICCCLDNPESFNKKMYRQQMELALSKVQYFVDKGKYISRKFKKNNPQLKGNK